MKHEYRLFLKHMNDIQMILETATQEAPWGYPRAKDDLALLDLALPIRKLLFDGSPLTPKVNRDFGLDIRFQLPIRMCIPALRPSVPGGTNPYYPLSDIKPGNMVQCKDFLSHVIFVLNKEPVTVKSAFDYAAYVDGGIHAGKSKDTIHDMLNDFNIGGKSFNGCSSLGWGLLIPIARIVHAGLRPLENAVRDRISKQVARVIAP